MTETLGVEIATPPKAVDVSRDYRYWPYGWLHHDLCGARAIVERECGVLGDVRRVVTVTACSAPAHHTGDHLENDRRSYVTATWRNITPPVDTFTCGRCRASFGVQYQSGRDITDGDVCNGCEPHLTECARCARYSLWGYAHTVNHDTLCQPCLDDNDWTECDGCGYYFEDGCNCGSWGCSASRCSACACEQDADDYEQSDFVNSYSYKPTPVFYKTATEGRPDGLRSRVYMGWELETEVRGVSVDTPASEVLRLTGDSVYLKEDSSISGAGFELVTHPMTHEYARTEFPWKVLNTMAANGCQIDPTENGLHVHVNRAGFSSPAHVYRWLKFMHRNSKHVARIARRDSSQWAAWSVTEREKAFKYAKGYDDGDYAPRYSAINVTNRNTFEVRVFAASLDQTEVMSALDTVHASVEYTRQLTSHAVNRGGWEWKAFLDWSERQDIYSALMSVEGR